MHELIKEDELMIKVPVSEKITIIHRIFKGNKGVIRRKDIRT